LTFVLFKFQLTLKKDECSPHQHDSRNLFQTRFVIDESSSRQNYNFINLQIILLACRVIKLTIVRHFIYIYIYIYIYVVVLLSSDAEEFKKMYAKCMYKIIMTGNN